MFNIEFNSYKPVQVSIGKFNIGEKEMEDLYCRKEDLAKLERFLVDIRTMPENEWEEVIGDLTFKIEVK